VRIALTVGALAIQATGVVVGVVMAGNAPNSLEELLKSKKLNVILSDRLIGNDFVTMHYDNNQDEWVVSCWMKRITTKDIDVALDEFLTIIEQLGEHKA
jgi:hypothetical protein